MFTNKNRHRSDKDDFDSLIRDMLKDLAAAEDSYVAASPPRATEQTTETTNPQALSTSSSIMQEALSALEQQLIHTNHPVGDGGSSMAASSSVGGYVIQTTASGKTPQLGQQQQQQQQSSRPVAPTASYSDAWLQSLNQFESLHLADDFVRADAAKKKDGRLGTVTGTSLVTGTGAGIATSVSSSSLLPSDRLPWEDYDVNEEPLAYLPTTKHLQAQSLLQPPSVVFPPTTVMQTPMPTSSLVQPPPRPPPPMMMMMTTMQPLPPQPVLNTTAAATTVPMMQHPSYHPYLPPPTIIQSTTTNIPSHTPTLMTSFPGTSLYPSPFHPPHPLHRMEAQGQVLSHPLIIPTPTPALIHSVTPIHATNQDTNNMGTMNTTNTTTTPSTPTPSYKIPPIRFFFHDTSPHARPIPASQIPTTSMTPRDLCYVIHSMLKPVLSFTSILDMYNADYYKWGYDQRRIQQQKQLLQQQQQALLFHPWNPSLHGGGGGSITSTNTPMLSNITSSISSSLPNPVWKETKQNAKEMEQEYLAMIQKRAEDFSHQKQNLGKLVKNDVKRPRALLSSSLLILNQSNTSHEGNIDDEEEEKDLIQDDLLHPQDKEEELQRINLWRARISIDQGYQTYLNWIELRRLLQTKGQEYNTLPTSTTATAGASQETKEGSNHSEDVIDNYRRLELLMDIETQVQKLHITLGISYKVSETSSTSPSSSSSSTLEINEPILARILSLPKGKLFFSRILDDGFLPHANACFILPHVLRTILMNTASITMGSSVSSVHEDERILRSLTGFVRLINPSPLPKTLLDCLEVVNTFATNLKHDKNAFVDIKRILSNHPTLLELLHTILSRGMDICGKADEAYLYSWQSREKEFVAVLTSKD